MMQGAGAAPPTQAELEFAALEAWYAAGTVTPDFSTTTPGSHSNNSSIWSEVTGLIRLDVVLPAAVNPINTLFEIGATGAGFAVGGSADGAPDDLYMATGNGGSYNDSGASWATVALAAGDWSNPLVAYFYGYYDPGHLQRMIAWLDLAATGIIRVDGTAATAFGGSDLWGTDDIGFLNVGGSIRKGVTGAASSATSGSDGVDLWVDPVMPGGVDLVNVNAP